LLSPIQRLDSRISEFSSSVTTVPKAVEARLQQETKQLAFYD